MIIDDEEILRNGIRNFINWEELHCEVCAVAENGLDAMRQFSALTPDIVITDIKMPGMDGLEFARKVNQTAPQTKIIILSGYADFIYAQQAIDCGVVDFVIKNNPAPKIHAAVRKAVSMIEQERKDSRLLCELEERASSCYYDLCVEFFKGVIQNRFPSPEEVEQRAAQLGINLSRFMLAILKLPQADNINASLAHGASILEFCRTTFQAFQPILFSMNNQFVCMVLTPDDGKANQDIYALKSTCEKAVDTLRELTGSHVSIGVSSLNNKASSLPVAYQSAFFALQNSGAHTSGSGVFFTEAHIQGTSPNRMISQAIQFIHEHFKEELSLRRIAKELHINASYLSRLFKKSMQENMISYITHFRVERAKEMLVQTNDKLSQVALECGFQDVSYFSNIFKKYSGYSPSEYKNKFS